MDFAFDDQIAATIQLDVVVARDLAGAKVEASRYCANHFLPFFESAERLTVSSVEDYSRMRLRHVTRPTVAKRLSAHRNFLGGAERNGEVDEAPVVRNPPKRSTGTGFGRQDFEALWSAVADFVLGR